MTSYSTLSTIIQEVPHVIESWLQKEIIDDEGLLCDVETFITTLENEMNLETPGIWITQQEWKSYDKKPLAKLQRLKVPVEIACIEYDEDLKQGELRAMNLVGRVVASLLKHYRRKQDLFNFISMNLVELYPNGTINVQSKQEIVSVAGILIEFVVDVNWLLCLNKDKNIVDLENE